ncbi:delta serrate ligand [Ancylostoma caninum]|uniref:Delta-like protein n=1 Tax=Ancylostoma caninum TaxID=29170 RepID=A0A368G6F6_ANCCA|nr:delta serrate ligand [Ancylostoma caninum]
MTLFLALLPLVLTDESPKSGSGVFTMTFSSTEIVYLNLCYMQWPSFAGSFPHSPCIFHPHPYNFTIRPEYAMRIGRPLRNIQSDYITVSINVTDKKGGSHGHILETIIVDGSLQSRSVYTDVLSVSFEVKCDENFFGRRCSRYCKPSAAENHLVRCTQTGEKECISGWTGFSCNDISDENRVITRLVRAGYPPTFEHHSEKFKLILGVAAFVTLFTGCALYSVNSQRRAHIQVTNVVTY